MVGGSGQDAVSGILRRLPLRKRLLSRLALQFIFSHDADGQKGFVSARKVINDRFHVQQLMS